MEKAVGGEIQGFPKGNWERGQAHGVCMGPTISREDLKGKMAECFHAGINGVGFIL